MTADQLKRAKDTLWAEVNRNVARKEDGSPGFILDEHNIPVLRELAHHMVGAPCQWLVPGCSVGFAGPVGTFKTEMLAAYSRTLIRGGGLGFPQFSMLRIEKSYSVSSKDEAQNGGAKVILKYGNMKCDIGLNDIGEEPMGQHFGVSCDVFAEIMSLRYVLWKEEGWLTHGTSNIIDEEGLRKRYDERTVSRYLEMTRWVPMGGPDRRPGSIPVNRRGRELFAPEPPMPSEEELRRSEEIAREGFKRVKEVIANAAAELKANAPMKVVREQAEPFTQDDHLTQWVTGLQDRHERELEGLREQIELGHTPLSAEPYLKAIDAELSRREKSLALSGGIDQSA